VSAFLLRNRQQVSLADRLFGSGSKVLETLKAGVAANALELAPHGKPRAPFCVTGQVTLAEMTPKERRSSLRMEQQNWRS